MGNMGGAKKDYIYIKYLVKISEKGYKLKISYL